MLRKAEVQYYTGTPEYQKRKKAEWDKTQALRGHKAASDKRYREKCPQKNEYNKAWERRSRDTLSDKYILQLLKQQGIPATPELVVLKRASIQMKRAAKSFGVNASRSAITP